MRELPYSLNSEQENVHRTVRATPNC